MAGGAWLSCSAISVQMLGNLHSGRLKPLHHPTMTCRWLDDNELHHVCHCTAIGSVQAALEILPQNKCTSMLETYSLCQEPACMTMPTLMTDDDDSVNGNGNNTNKDSVNERERHDGVAESSRITAVAMAYTMPRIMILMTTTSTSIIMTIISPVYVSQDSIPNARKCKLC